MSEGVGRLTASGCAGEEEDAVQQRLRGELKTFEVRAARLVLRSVGGKPSEIPGSWKFPVDAFDLVSLTSADVGCLRMQSKKMTHCRDASSRTGDSHATPYDAYDDLGEVRGCLRSRSKRGQ